MDYEKKDSENTAVKTIMRMIANGEISQEVAEKYFPELAESEDEKVRKELLLDIPKVFPHDKAFRYIAYLEKQGEHANFRNKIQIGDKVTRNEDGVLVNLSQLNRVAKKQGEQKPAEWTHKDGKNLAELWEILSVYRNTNPQVDNLMEWVKDLVSYKRQEWSEEDGRCIRYLIECLEVCVKGTAIKMLPSTAQKYIEWLKSLSPQSQWKAVDKEIYVKEPALAQRKDKSEPNHGYVICYDHTLTPDVYERFIMISDIYNQSHWKPSDEHKGSNRVLGLYQDKKRAITLEVMDKARKWANGRFATLPEWAKFQAVLDALYCAYLEGAGIRTR